MQKCARITQYLQSVGIEVCDLPNYEGLLNMETFLTEFEDKVLEPQ